MIAIIYYRDLKNNTTNDSPFILYCGLLKKTPLRIKTTFYKSVITNNALQGANLYESEPNRKLL